MVRRFCFILFVSLVWAPTVWAAPPPATQRPTAARDFFATYCYACHDADTHSAGLRLDTLTLELTEKEHFAAWEKVFDKLREGQMPPPEADQPQTEERQSVEQWLGASLHEASLARQRAEGRVRLRRLNRTEYENTLRDLLAVPVQVKQLLPEDNSAAGFDNVSATFDVASAHLLRYQQAAEKALATPTRPAQPLKRKLDAQTLLKIQGEHGFNCLHKHNVRVRDEKVIVHSRLNQECKLRTPAAPQTGRYRIQVTASAINTDGKSISLAFCIQNNSIATFDTEGDVQAWHDVLPGKATTVTAEMILEKGQQVVVAGWTLPSVSALGQSLNKLQLPVERFNGPGLAIELLEIEGPLDTWPPESYRRLFDNLPLQPRSVARAEAAGAQLPTIADNRSDEQWNQDPLIPVSLDPAADAERLLRVFARRAFRRPVSDDLLQYYIRFVHSRLERGYEFHEALLAGYKAVLCSPHFLFFDQVVSGSGGAAKLDKKAVDKSIDAGRLDDHAIASRLSYFLWSSMPDEILLDLAAKQQLRQPVVLHEQVERMLHDPRSARFTQNFVGQWLDLRMMEATTPDPSLYAEFDRPLFYAMSRETESFFDEVLRNDLSLLNFIDSDWTFLNDRLAQHYGIPGIVAGSKLRKVKLPPNCHRGGVMTHASVLKVTADGARTSPILRGKWILERMLGMVTPPPPAGIPTLEPDIRGANTIREQLAKHRSQAACATCHAYIDPPGFALETYDVIGGWRDFYRIPRGKQEIELSNYPGMKVFRGPDVEKGDVTPQGHPFYDIDDYKRLLLADKPLLARNLTKKLLIYATGADIQFADREIVERIVDRLAQKNFGLRSLVHEVVESRVFLSK